MMLHPQTPILALPMPLTFILALTYRHLNLSKYMLTPLTLALSTN
jgi:hypothetical protein